MLAERTGDSMEQAFTRLRTYARNHNLRLADVAQRLIEGELPTQSLRLPRPARPTELGEPGARPRPRGATVSRVGATLGHDPLPRVGVRGRSARRPHAAGS